MIPTGPQPVTSTRLADRLAAKAVCTALPKFSWIVPSSGGMSGGSTQALMAGSATYSAKAPSRSTPRMRVCWQMCPRPVRQK